MDEGLYESLFTAQLEARVAHAREFGLEDRRATVDAADQPYVLARHVHDAVAHVLAGTSEPQARIALVNSVLRQLDKQDLAPVLPGPQQLTGLIRPAGPGRASVSLSRPSTPLSDAALLTNAPGEPGLGSELRAELGSANEVDLICAFVQWHGLRLFEAQLLRARERGAPIRVITTTYIGATERVALDRLVRMFGAQVKVQYDALRTRLHAKAWLFRRLSGFDTAYVGSSNLSRAAMIDGVEWNVRLSKVSTPTVLAKFQATFDTYWNDATFELYDPDRDRDRLDDALAEASGRRVSTRITLALSGLEVRPYPHQSEMLEKLDVERVVHDRHRNLIVAATGTGKTVVAALDYRRFCDETTTERPSLLFVAHRKEILEQSLRTYREVLNDASFGEFYVDGARPERWSHVFASVQSLTRYGVANIAPESFAIVVVDEFHHAEAATYRSLLDHLQPRELLGLTATPERADGVDVRSFFGNRTAAELRLWDALSAELLSPFHYFGIADGVDLTNVAWKRGTYDVDGLANLYTANDARARIVLAQLHDKIGDVPSMRALGFCVSVAHAEYMARIFNESGIPSRAVTGTTSALARTEGLAALRSREINTIFTVDLFNEGIDLPDVDTVLFLRPTESATVFLQQLGRGLRRTQNKAVLTALDFVGHQREEFRFDTRYRALTGATRRGLEHQVERDFPFLPSGCQIVLDEQTQQDVLHNIRGQLTRRWTQLVAELRDYGDLSLAEFLAESGTELGDLTRGERSWTRLRREAGQPVRSGAAHEGQLLKRVRALAHVDDPERAAAYSSLLDDEAPPYADLDERGQRLARMLFFSLWPNGGGFAAYEEGLQALHAEAAVRDEIRAVVELGLDGAQHVTAALAGPLADIPLRTHALYQREEILSALDYANLTRRPSTFQAGVVWSDGLRTDAFLVTLRKSEADFSPTTMYRDYPVSRSLFHWESQVGTSVASPTGQRYLTGASTVLLFTRGEKRNELGTAPYLFLGPARYVQHRGERPIAITWRLEAPMPVDFFTSASVAS